MKLAVGDVRTAAELYVQVGSGPVHAETATAADGFPITDPDLVRTMNVVTDPENGSAAVVLCYPTDADALVAAVTGLFETRSPATKNPRNIHLVGNDEPTRQLADQAHQLMQPDHDGWLPFGLEAIGVEPQTKALQPKFDVEVQLQGPLAVVAAAVHWAGLDGVYDLALPLDADLAQMRHRAAVNSTSGTPGRPMCTRR